MLRRHQVFLFLAGKTCQILFFLHKCFIIVHFYYHIFAHISSLNHQLFLHLAKSSFAFPKQPFFFEKLIFRLHYHLFLLLDLSCNFKMTFSWFKDTFWFFLDFLTLEVAFFLLILQIFLILIFQEGFPLSVPFFA